MERRHVRPQAGQESVWDYPRPPRLEAVRRRLRVVFAGRTIVDVDEGWRVLETTHPPVYYVAADRCRDAELRRTAAGSFCEFKGRAVYYDLVAGDRTSPQAAWSYPSPTRAFAALAGHVAVYASRVDACYVDDELVQAQAGDFYGGWITRDVVGPFKGEPGSAGW